MRIIVIVFLLFMLIVSICCNWTKKEVRRKSFMAEQQESTELHYKLRKKENWQRFMYTKRSTVGRYEIFQDLHPQFAKNTFLLDTMDGRIWILNRDQETEKLWWRELDVENRDTISTEEFLKTIK